MTVKIQSISKIVWKQKDKITEGERREETTNTTSEAERTRA